MGIMGKQTRFQLVDGRIILKVEHLVWGEWINLIEEDVTDQVMPVVDDYLDDKLGLHLSDYGFKGGKINYTGEDKK
jgi:hypothetical protein